MDILLFVAFFATLGFVLYLPFLLWFWYRRKRLREIKVERHITKTYLALLCLWFIVMFAGLAAGSFAPESLVGALTKRPVGCVIWALGTWFVFRTLEVLLTLKGVLTKTKVVLPIANRDLEEGKLQSSVVQRPLPREPENL